MKIIRIIRLLFIIVFLVFSLFYCSLNNKKKNSKGTKSLKEHNFYYLKQKEKKRILIDKEYAISKKILFKHFKGIVSLPSFLRFDDFGNIFFWDFKTSKIVGIFFEEKFKKYKVVEFIKRIGEGPQEIGACQDFKIKGSYFFISDRINGAVKIFKKEDGKLNKIVKMMKKGKPVIPYKILPLNDKELIVNPLVGHYEKNTFFALVNIGNNKIISYFGNNFDCLENDSSLYNDQYFSKVFEGDKYYSIARFLGVVALYKRDKLIFYRETIDGYHRPKIIRKNLGNIHFSTINKDLETSVGNSIGDNFIINKAYDRVKDIVYWDFYSLNDFSYLFTLKKHPKSIDFDIFNNYVCCSTEDGIIIYDMSNIFNEARKKALNIHKM